jgi:hypothetical protein
MRLLAALVVLVGVGQATTGGASNAAAQLPRLSVQSATVTKTVRGGTVSVKMRLCASIGPKAVLTLRETRTVRGRVLAQARQVEPLGVDLDRIYPYSCANRYQSSWIVQPRLIRAPGTYRVVIRLRDGYGRLSTPIAVSLALGDP